MRGRELVVLIENIRADTDVEPRCQRRGSSLSIRLNAKPQMRERPPRRAGAALPLISRITVHSEHAVVALAGGAAEIGVALARYELGRSQREAHLVLVVVLTTP